MSQKTATFPNIKDLLELAEARQRVSELEEKFKKQFQGSRTKLSDIEEKLLKTMQDWALTNVLSKGEVKTFTVTFEDTFASGGLILKNNTYDEMKKGMGSNSKVLLTMKEFNGLSERERGKSWQEFKRIFGQLKAAGLVLQEIKITEAEDRMLDRAWVHPVTLTIGLAS